MKVNAVRLHIHIMRFAFAYRCGRGFKSYLSQLVSCMVKSFSFLSTQYSSNSLSSSGDGVTSKSDGNYTEHTTMFFLSLPSPIFIYNATKSPVINPDTTQHCMPFMNTAARCTLPLELPSWLSILFRSLSCPFKTKVLNLHLLQLPN